jgi:dynein heavy chain, axonemal
MIQDGDGTLNRPEFDFFLKGNTSLDEVEDRPHSWISPNGWKDACKLHELGDAWLDFTDSIKKQGPVWQKWYDLEAPEMSPMPCGFDKLDRFQKLLVCRILRNDRCINAIKQYIIEKMGEYYVKSPLILYDKIYAQSTEKTPIVFILSPGADPQGELEILGDQMGFGP